jgi:hypothetical protein
MDLSDVAKMVEKLRLELLFEFDGAGLDPQAEQNYLMVLSHLELAERHAKLASLQQAAALGGR